MTLHLAELPKAAGVHHEFYHLLFISDKGEEPCSLISLEGVRREVIAEVMG